MATAPRPKAVSVEGRSGSNSAIKLAPPPLPSAIKEASPIVRKPGQPLQTKVQFRVCFPQVSYGGSVRVVGGHPKLGNWEPSGALPLTSSQDTFPCWISPEPVLFESNKVVEYKYVIMGQDGKLQEWETHEGNRKIKTSGAEMIVEDDEGQYRQFEREGPLDREDEDAEIVQPAFDYSNKEMMKLLHDHKMATINELEPSAKIGPHDTIFMVAISLPIELSKGKDGKWKMEEKPPTDGRNFAWLPLVQEFREKAKRRVVCVGWPGVHVTDYRDKAEIEKLLTAHDYIPVFPSKEDFDTYVNFCTTFLWPVFHDVMMFYQTSKPITFDEQGWATYQYVNNLYANAVVPHTHESDVIWVHDYHLMMTSTFISRKVVKANIGFYLHTPFPSSDSFKSLPIREELLSGMLCNDQLGFQFFAYARNFVVSVKRICGYDPSFKAGGWFGLEVNGRHIMIRVAHFVYPYKDTLRAILTDTVAKEAAEIRNTFKDKVVFASMDRCDNLSGLVPKFRAFKRFLSSNPQYKGKAILVQYTFESAAGSNENSSNLLRSLTDRADAFLQGKPGGGVKIVGKDGGAPPESCDVYLRFEKASRDERLGLFRAADVLLDTAVKAGLNLMPFEFITAHHDDKEKNAISIVSEFSGCSRVLLGCVRINPWNTVDVVNCLRKAIEMSSKERQELFDCNLQYVSRSNPFEWFKDFLEDLRRSRKKEGMRFEAVGFGAKIRHIAMTQNFQKLPTDAVLAAYRNAKNRVLLFDNEGTLAADSRHLFREYGAPKKDLSDLNAHGSAPNERVLECLRALCADSRNTVVILSGRNQSMLEQWFGSIPKIGLAAERGFYYRLPSLGSQWHCMKSDPDDTWQNYTYTIMQQFMKRTQGSFIEMKGSALVWQYRDADQHFGSWQAKELSRNLKELLFGFDVEVLDGKGYVEVKLRGVNKGIACTKVVSKVTQLFGDVDFVLCLGDDRSDEDMFEALAAYFDEEESSSQLSTTDGDSDNNNTNANLNNNTVASDGTTPGGPSDGMSPEQTLLRTSGTLGGISKSKRGFGGGFGSIGGGGSGGGGSLASALGGGSGALARGDLSMRMGKLLGGSLGGSGGLEDLVSGLHGQKVFTCTVGRKPSAAKFYLDDVDEVSELLGSLKTQQERKAYHVPSSSHTWSGGDLRPGGARVGSMPSLSGLAYGPPPTRQKQ
mmetsp:Transcript_80297/g.167196  ORF Transcript_80297/g.167196 Transcript_80297/m.167196 type:complete len:1183 (-) Transcript_80297:102-3650(-)|eukprot:CAMPEP_0206438024 /NCGR_PEP_ID=MMETSP0324_2-20121206/11375_1 /ASSEMBLY_ACC=CAM_ASM_000836 /TAXON_ID=2866 /ORGANISM="Crypthecodinium cohnii, Strain Seligo" /LENGTH=1182 /DNA_ID=CAMNT_0053905387 /DNA_START=250 /DNA_END=3798 /DNA_ORIENTATION=-